VRVLLTGADGFVGQHVARLLLARGHDVVGAISHVPPSLRLLGDAEARAVAWRPFQLTDPASIRAAVAEAKPEAVVHLAGSSSVARSWERPAEVMQVNALGALHLLLALRDVPATGSRRPVLLAGSAESYGREGTEREPLVEDLPLEPRNPYAASKAAQEMMGWALAQGSDRLLLARGFPHSGPGQRPPFVLPQWTHDLLRMRRGELPPVLSVGNLDVVRDLVDVRDVAEAYVALLEAPEAEGVFNVCSGRGYRLGDVLAKLCALVGVQPEVRTDPTRLRPSDIRSLVGSRERLSRATGWTPKRSLDEMLRDLVADLDAALDDPQAAHAKNAAG
jgi:GDP-4-dehydro-6-deoxy-D-mannose reductase